jgi:hypothetical protein
MQARENDMQPDLVYIAIGLGTFVLLFGLLAALDERALDRRR